MLQMNSTAQNSSGLSTTTGTYHQADDYWKLVILWTCLPVTVLVLTFLSLRSRLLAKKPYDKKERVNLLFESGSSIQLHEKKASKDDSFCNLSESTSLLSYESENVEEVKDLKSFSLSKTKQNRSQSNLFAHRRCQKKILIWYMTWVRRKELCPKTNHWYWNMTFFQEERIMSGNILMVLKVKPLQAVDNNENGNGDGKEMVLSGKYLDWNKVFSFLVNIIEPATWKLFFIELFDYGQHLFACGKTSNLIIEQTKLSHNGAMSGLFFELFHEWLKLMGTEANTAQIEKALHEHGDNHALIKFKNFLRTPPLLPENIGKSGSEYLIQDKPKLPILNLVQINMSEFHKEATDRNQRVNVMTLRNVDNTQAVANEFKTCSISQDTQNSTVNNLMTKDRSKEDNNPQAMGDGKDKIVCRSNKRKRNESCTSTCSISDDNNVEEPSNKFRKHDMDSSLPMYLRRRHKYSRNSIDKKSANYCRQLVCWEKIDQKFVIELIKRVLPTNSKVLKSEEYYLFLHHTVNIITKKAVVHEMAVLVMLVDDFNDRCEQQTKRGRLTCTIDTSQDVLMIGYEELEYLKLYVDHARQRVIRKLIENKSDITESKYVFIDYNGKPLAEKVKMNDSKTFGVREAIDKEIIEMNFASGTDESHADTNIDETKAIEGFTSIKAKVKCEPVCQGNSEKAKRQDEISSSCLEIEKNRGVSKFGESEETKDFSSPGLKIDDHTDVSEEEFRTLEFENDTKMDSYLQKEKTVEVSMNDTKSKISENTPENVALEETGGQIEYHDDFIKDIDTFSQEIENLNAQNK